MNLKEIGTLLTGLYGLTLLLMSYKYYHAKGGVFQLSGLLVFKYILRFLTLLAILLLCYNVLLNKQIAQIQVNNNPKYLVAISATYSSLNWNDLKENITELPPNAEYGLVKYNITLSKWEQIIPTTNQDSFINLLEHEQVNPVKAAKKMFVGTIDYNSLENQYSILRFSNNKWIQEQDLTTKDSILSKNAYLSWIQASYVPLYLVILILIFSFIDIVFTIKAFRI